MAASPSLNHMAIPHATKFITWNVKGLNNFAKRKRVFNHLSTFKPDIVFLQETHLRSSQSSRLSQSWLPHVYHSGFNSKSRGVAILIRKNFPFILTDVQSDINGRFVMVTGKLHNTPVILLNVYAPNWDNPQFFTRLISMLPDLNTHYLIMGGDMNLIFNPILDRSIPRKSAEISKSASVLSTFLKNYSISDPLRAVEPLARYYSFFSPVHHSYSRIDYFFLDNALIPKVTLCKYHAIVISDHAPVQMDILLPNTAASQRLWRFDSSLLADEDFCKFITFHIEVFLETNNTPGISKSIIWESLKAYLRGQIISFAAHKNKKRNARLRELTELIANLDSQYATNPSADLYKQKLLLQSEFNTLSIKETEKLLLRSRHQIYEHGEKAGRLLSHQLRQSISNQLISEIRLESDQVTTDPKEINSAFKQFYQDLYSSQANYSQAEIDLFLDKIQFPNITQDQQELLEGPLTTAEILQAIKSLQNGKAPGPDGFSCDFYKAFSSKLAPLLTDVFLESHTNLKLPQTLSQATISVILKKDKDAQKCASYRPISLLNVDYKILTKVLALRLEKVAPTIIHEDQTGFIANRHSYFNVRRLYNILYSDHSTDHPEIIISLDAEKAFDCVEWSYLFSVLSKFGFGSSFISWIKILYSAPQSSVRTNNLISDYFTLHRGTRQGCPLSPLLFNLAIEPLALMLRTQLMVRGITRGGVTHKVSLYADDLLLYLSEPENSIPAVLDILGLFGRFSGYKLNLGKSILFPLNQLARVVDYSQFLFKVEHSSFSYLGIQISATFKDLFKKNFTPLLEKIKSDLSRWSLLPISLAGRVNTIKMVVLPKFMYLFQMVPLFLPKIFFNKIDEVVSSFIWDKKAPRIRKSLLQCSKSEGGLALPNFLYYYWSANIVKLSTWVRANREGRGPLWTTLELNSDSTASPIAIMCSALPIGRNVKFKNPVVQNTLNIWFQCRRHFDFKQLLICSPIISNPLFQPALNDSGFKLWFNKGIVQISDLFVEGSFLSFERLTKDFDIPKTHFFRYLQIRSFVAKHFITYPGLPPACPLEDCLRSGTIVRGQISRTYALLHHIKPESLSNLKKSWESDLNLQISEDLWDLSISRIHSTSICIRHCLIQLKVFHRSYLTKAKLAKIYNTSDDGCPRCGQSPATMNHMFWSCNDLSRFWVAIFKVFSHICNRIIDHNPITAIFGVIPNQYGLNSYQSNAVAFLSLLARRLILQKWKDARPPSFIQWVKEVMMCLQLEKLRYCLRGAQNKYYKTWTPFIEYVEKLPFVDT